MNSKSIAHTNSVFLLVLLYTLIIKQGESNDLMREIKFKSYDTGRGVCAIEDPSQVVNSVRSKIQCTALCQETPGCYSVNWKETSTCEIFFTTPKCFATPAMCTHFVSGEYYYIILVLQLVLLYVFIDIWPVISCVLLLLLLLLHLRLSSKTAAKAHAALFIVCWLGQVQF